MKPRSSIIAKWQWNDVGPDEIATAESASWLGRATAVLFAAAAVGTMIGIVVLVGLPEREGIELRRVIERHERTDDGCNWNVTAVFHNHDATDVDVDRLEIAIRGTTSFVRASGDGVPIPAGETVEMTVSHPIGATCSGSIRDIDHGDISMFIREPPDGETRVRTFRL